MRKSPASLGPSGAELTGLPVAIYLVVTGAIWQGLVLIAYGVCVIGLVDNLLRRVCTGPRAASQAICRSIGQSRSPRHQSEDHEVVGLRVSQAILLRTDKAPHDRSGSDSVIQRCRPMSGLPKSGQGWAIYEYATLAAGLARVGRRRSGDQTAWLRMQSEAKRSRRPFSLQFAICREICTKCRERPVRCL